MYLVGKIIGEGAYASVRVAIYKPLEKKIAIKIYEKNKIKEPQRKKSVRREIKILGLLQHPNIVKNLDVVETNNHLNIVMEYLSGTSLGSFLKSQPLGKIPEKHCKKIFRSLTKALSYMHSLNIAHRDIKL
jgi:MAP/microtubule affinity-regulating kinase